MKRLKVLIGAHELSPAQGSECAVGWNIVTRLAQFHDVTVLYASGSQFHRTSYVDAVNSHLTEHGPIAGLRLINIDQRPLTNFFAGINKIFLRLGPTGLPMLYYLGYKYWQRSAFHRAKKLHETEKFDVAHQLTQISFREPGYLWKLGIPFIWGPTGGTERMPKKYYRILSGKYQALEWVRKFSNWYQFRFIGRVVKANKRAATIYAFSNGDARRLQRRAKGRVKVMLDVGTHSHDMVGQRENGKGIINGIWCGRLTELKAPMILLLALSMNEVTRENVRVKIIGEGPLLKELKKQAIKLGLKNIEWVGNIEHSEIFKFMGEADFLIHTSLREATSSVIPEALSMGLPVICHDAYGMSIAINESCGIKVPLSSPAASIEGFHAALERLVKDPVLLGRLKLGARKRCEEISWKMMAEIIAQDYVDTVEAFAANPDGIIQETIPSYKPVNI